MRKFSITCVVISVASLLFSCGKTKTSDNDTQKITRINGEKIKVVGADKSITTLDRLWTCTADKSSPIASYDNLIYVQNPDQKIASLFIVKSETECPKDDFDCSNKFFMDQRKFDFLTVEQDDKTFVIKTAENSKKAGIVADIGPAGTVLFTLDKVTKSATLTINGYAEGVTTSCQ